MTPSRRSWHDLVAILGLKPRPHHARPGRFDNPRGNAKPSTGTSYADLLSAITQTLAATRRSKLCYQCGEDFHPHQPECNPSKKKEYLIRQIKAKCPDQTYFVKAIPDAVDVSSAFEYADPSVPCADPLKHETLSTEGSNSIDRSTTGGSRDVPKCSQASVKEQDQESITHFLLSIFADQAEGNLSPLQDFN